MALDLRKVPVSEIKGLNTKQRHAVDKLGITNVYDLITWFPFKYKDIDPQNIGTKTNREKTLVTGKPVQLHIGKTHPITATPLKNGAIRITMSGNIVNSAGQSKYDIRTYDEIHVVVHFDVFRLEKYAPILEDHKFFNVQGVYKGDDVIETNSYSGNITPFTCEKPITIRLMSYYHSTKGVKQGNIRWAIFCALRQFYHKIPDIVSPQIRAQEDLMPRNDAIVRVHFPENKDQKNKAVKSEKFQELYKYELKLQRLNAERKRKPGFSIKYNSKLLKRFNKSLPYTLTHDQKNATKDVLSDLNKPFKMNRLLQGDVGSGKTVVAAFGALATISAGFQVALMAPTSILSEQHYATFLNAFKDFGVNIALLNGRSSTTDRKKVHDGLKSGRIQLVIGTHSLFQKSLQYKNLGMAIVDEQQLFGVHQRKALANKTKGCNVLSLTATPIPRTLAISLYGSMDTSIITQKPNGRKPVKTKWHKSLSDLSLKNTIERTVRNHGQVFVVTRLVKPSARIKQSDSITTCYHLNKILDPSCRAQYLNSQMPNGTKEHIIKNFKSGRIKVLVATTIVGVGMDISNANLIIIYDAEDYGLAQLHQLRGRVGRNDEQAHCILLGNPGKRNGGRRLKAMEKTNDGFKLSRIDLKMRHSGNIFGRMQHGLPDFKLADLSRDKDLEILTNAMKEANTVVRKEQDNKTSTPSTKSGKEQEVKPS